MDRREKFGEGGQGALTPVPSPKTQITGAILAGGASRRLGQDKASLMLGGKPLASWVAAALEPLVSACWLITNQPLAHLGLGLPMLTDLKAFQGPLGGLVTALFYSRTPWVLVSAVDNPFLSPSLLAALISRVSRAARPAVVSRSARGLEPFPGLYATRLLPRLTAFLQTGLRPLGFLELCRPHIVGPEEVNRLDPEGWSFLNLNTAEDLEEARDLLMRKGGLGAPALNLSF